MENVWLLFEIDEGGSRGVDMGIVGGFDGFCVGGIDCGIFRVVGCILMWNKFLILLIFD